MRNKRIIGILCFSDMSNEINLLLFLLFYLVVFVPPLYMLEPVMRTEQKINPRTKGMQGDLKMGDR